jgi:hypothetical protein
VIAPAIVRKRATFVVFVGAFTVPQTFVASREGNEVRRRLDEEGSGYV